MALLKVSPDPSPSPRATGRRFAMLRAIVRVAFGFTLACLAAGAAMTAFVITPADLASGDPDQLAAAGVLTLLSAADSARFAAPFAPIATVIGEWRSIRGWIYYTSTGAAIALAGFLVQYANSAASPRAIADIYALAAFLTAGFAAGFVYWTLAGRLAGGPDRKRLQPMAGTPGQSATSGPGRKSADTPPGPVGRDRQSAHP